MAEYLAAAPQGAPRPIGDTEMVHYFASHLALHRDPDVRAAWHQLRMAREARRNGNRAQAAQCLHWAGTYRASRATGLWQ